MSILNQSFTIEKFDGTETICRDISALVRKDPMMFRLNYGTHFNFRPVPKDRFGRTPSYRNYTETESVFWVEIPYGSVYTFRGTFEILQKPMLADCKFIIRDGFGRAVHPDVIYQAYVERYGAKSTLYYEITYYGHSTPVKRGYNGQLMSTRWDRGQRASCWCGDRSDYRFKRQLSQMSESRSRANTISDELVENEWDVLPIPQVRHGSIDGTWAGRDWDRPRRTTHKSWKSQSKAQKSWAKRLK